MGVYDYVHINGKLFQTRSFNYEPSMRAPYLHHYKIEGGKLYHISDESEERQYFYGVLKIRSDHKDDDNQYVLWMKNGEVKDYFAHPHNDIITLEGLLEDKEKRKDIPPVIERKAIEKAMSDEARLDDSKRIKNVYVVNAFEEEQEYHNTGFKRIPGKFPTKHIMVGVDFYDGTKSVVELFCSSDSGVDMAITSVSTK